MKPIMGRASSVCAGRSRLRGRSRYRAAKARAIGRTAHKGRAGPTARPSRPLRTAGTRQAWSPVGQRPRYWSTGTGARLIW